MPSRDEIMEIRSESFADDVPIIDGMESWTEDQIRDYFDSGGTDAPSPSPPVPTVPAVPAAVDVSDSAEPPAAATKVETDPMLNSVLDDAGLGHLATVLAGERLDKLWSMERAPLLSALKSKGVEKLSDRQKAATVIVKAKTGGGTTVSHNPNAAPIKAATPAPATPPHAPAPAPVPAPAPLPPVAPTEAIAAAPADSQLAGLLDELSLTHLNAPLATETLKELKDLSRPVLLTRLKDAGVIKLPERQKLATAIAKAGSGASIAPAKPVDVSSLMATQATKPPRSDPDELPTPGLASQNARKTMPPLPAYKRLSSDDMKKNANLNCRGEWYGLALPDSLQQITDKKKPFGAKWLTQAFQASGVLQKDDAVVEILSFNELPLQGLDAQGGAGEKAIMTVKYKNENNGL